DPGGGPVSNQQLLRQCSGRRLRVHQQALRHGERRHHRRHLSLVHLLCGPQEGSDHFSRGRLPVAPKDEGMSLGGAISALELKGACLERNWPFDINRVNDTPNDSCFNEAVRFKIADSKKVPVDLSSMRRCLAEGSPIVFGLKLTAQFFKPLRG
ncbi:unnamed protein product, partial [Effrenium voratum]